MVKKFQKYFFFVISMKKASILYIITIHTNHISKKYVFGPFGTIWPKMRRTISQNQTSKIMDGSPTDDLLSNPSSADDPSYRLDDLPSAPWPIIGLMKYHRLDDLSSAWWTIVSSMTHHRLNDPSSARWPIIISAIQSSSQWFNHHLGDPIIGSMI